ncbi:MAG: hypothetical protein PHH98_00935 [Candidatus Gracilibacteria bacterium]|nr:hypothetical protein [Candidatus Gracilibacteria bacterium]
MKKIIITILLLLTFSFTSYAQYIEGQSSSNNDNIYTTLASTDMSNDVRMCTLEYAPVCAEVQVQCIKAPCFPVNETFGNACMAGDNKILYAGTCDMYINNLAYTRYQVYAPKLETRLNFISTDVLYDAIDYTNNVIQKTALLKLTTSEIRDRITVYTFIKDLFKKEISSRY